jgi:hypothetical protein
MEGKSLKDLCVHLQKGARVRSLCGAHARQSGRSQRIELGELGTVSYVIDNGSEADEGSYGVAWDNGANIEFNGEYLTLASMPLPVLESEMINISTEHAAFLRAIRAIGDVVAIADGAARTDADCIPQHVIDRFHAWRTEADCDGILDVFDMALSWISALGADHDTALEFASQCRGDEGLESAAASSIPNIGTASIRPDTFLSIRGRSVGDILVAMPDDTFLCEWCATKRGVDFGDPEVETWEIGSHGWTGPVACERCHLSLPVYIDEDTLGDAVYEDL